MDQTAPPPVTAPSTIAFDAYCSGCGYPLRGLSTAGNCRKCAKSIEQSLKGDGLEFASPVYVKDLHLGVMWILASVIAPIVSVFLMIGALAALGAFTRPQADQVEWIAPIFAVMWLGVSALSILGYWKFTTPDPDLVHQEGTRAVRRVLRAAAAASAVVAVLIVYLAFPHDTWIPRDVMDMAALASLAVSATQFLATMKYLRWLAPRIPNVDVLSKSKKYIWLLPLLYTVGAPLFGLGPLIALALYWNLLDKLRKDFKRLRAIVESGPPTIQPQPSPPAPFPP